MNFSDKMLKDFVLEAPDSTLDWNRPECPMCGSVDLEEVDEESTTIGWFPKEPLDDVPNCPGNPNTTTKAYVCFDCTCEFLYQVRFGNVCVIEDSRDKERSRKIFKGVPWGVSISERYTCKECGGDVVAKSYRVPMSKLVVPTEGQHGYHLKCSSCDLDVKIKSEFGFEPRIPYNNGLPKGPWMLENRKGVCVINAKALQKKDGA